MKRAMDFVLSFLGLVLLSPVLLGAYVLIRFFLGAPVFFKQPRPGYQDQSFNLIKFRTMNDEVGEDGALLPDDVRLTKLGRFLRATSIDELPELWNVLKGEMSLVGPRPLLEEYLPLYTPEQKKRHDVRPGITGWAQINGRNAISWEQKFEHDTWYVEHQSLWLDIKILFLTIKKVFRREGIQAEDCATARKFTGTSSCQS